MAKTRQPGDLLKAFNAKKQKAAMPGMDSPEFYSKQPMAGRALAKQTAGSTTTRTLPGTGSVSRVQSGPWAAPVSIKMKGGKKRKSSVKMSGKFQGKSNALGQGGRAAQLKARGVPGGVIGNLARAAQAAPGQKNYHKKKRKVSKLDRDMAFKKKRKGTHKKKASR